jgi:hypothetical protein
LCGNRRIEGFILFGLEVHLCLRGGFPGWESAIEAEAVPDDCGVEEGQGELVMVHGEALVKNRVRARAQRMTAAGFCLDAKAEGEVFREDARLGGLALGVV